jgi:hypothetical protein
VFDDIDYEKNKILAREDSAIRDFMIQSCYVVAGIDLVLSNACDLVESDAISLLWNELNYAVLIDYHRNKYLFEHAFMNATIFDPLITQFTQIQSETSSLLTELYDHRQLTISNIENLISQRTNDILSKYKNKTSYFDPGFNSEIISVDSEPNRPSQFTNLNPFHADSYVTGDSFWMFGKKTEKRKTISGKDRHLKDVNKNPIDRFREANTENLKIRDKLAIANKKQENSNNLKNNEEVKKKEDTNFIDEALLDSLDLNKVSR